MTETHISLEIDDALKRHFLMTCLENDVNPSQVMTTLMKRFIHETFEDKVATISLSGDADTESKGQSAFYNAFTGLQYSPDKPDEVLTVQKAVWLRRKFLQRHPEAPILPYGDRKKRKDDAWQVLKNHAMPLPDRVTAAENLIKAYYARSVEASLVFENPFSYQFHPGFAEYARHYIASSSADFFLDNAIMTELTQKYPPVKASQICLHDFYWRKETH